MEAAKVNSVHYEGRGRRRDVEEGESSIMEKMDAKKACKINNSRANAGPVPSVKVTPRKMLREALDAEERRVTAMLIERERRYREMLTARESLMETEKREAMVLVKEEEEVREGEKKVEKEAVKEEIIKKRESEAIGEAVVEVVDVKDEEEKKVDEKAVGGVSEKQEAESWVTMARDDWGWTWTCGERENYWWEGVCYPYWEKMCGEHWVASKIGDEDQALWKDEIWDLKHTKKVPKP